MTFVTSVPARTLRLMSAVRSARVFHPEGVLLAGTLELRDDASSPTVQALGGGAQHDVVVRVSRAVGTPTALPDIWGLALRAVIDDHRVDLLLATVGRHRLTTRLLAPAGGWLARPYSTLLPYRADGVRVTLEVRSTQSGRSDARSPEAILADVQREPARLVLTEERDGCRKVVGALVLTGPWDSGSVSYDPLVNAHPRLRHTAAFADLRARAYRHSRRGRDADPISLARDPDAGDSTRGPADGRPPAPPQEPPD